MAKRGAAAVTICSTAFITLAKAQASAVGNSELPIAVIPHPFGLRSRDEVRQMADQCVDDIAKLVSSGK
jgi:hypothetical protein